MSEIIVIVGSDVEAEARARDYITNAVALGKNVRRIVRGELVTSAEFRIYDAAGAERFMQTEEDEQICIVLKVSD